MKKIYKGIKRAFISDLLVVLAMAILIGTTFTLSIHVAFYLLAVALFGLSYFVAKGAK